ncbi:MULTISPECIES: hypothetical protein [Streptomyces]|uniref:SMI1/KNR4 family protein n=1 Tax=Streptomyces glycanivorans TaxID=3033808 RepID=A0ABY9J583_9ACTN|nr:MULTISPECIES: hypothetical protein [unclassified Streptomyces]WSQ76471.1 hypothetical protein OG725_04905 [Streptomyces sp. NBC_01213]WLQ62958.1 hypothetical protein P8A20_04815 [Streptomyces sp. Alt3]WSQ83800.1 hypothetical protein OG722_05330 [Streptomyces sp. NBC_01212]WSR10253.1 hypothetical protein OG265_31450 [Streptomyces sp. NBC_01208]WSR47048.1 hypothetical protein OG279_05170 [Streptomyces sp. NBC_01201]
MTTILRHPRPGFMWDWWAVDAQGFLVQFSGGPAPEHLLAHVDRVDAAAAWAEENCPAWFNDAPPSLHAFNCNGELPVYTRNSVPDSPLRLSDTPVAIADAAALVELNKTVGDTWTVYLDQGWV